MSNDNLHNISYKNKRFLPVSATQRSPLIWAKAKNTTMNISSCVLARTKLDDYNLI